jgi:hypothetical protein
METVIVVLGLGENHPGAHAAAGLVDEQAFTVRKMFCGQLEIKLTIIS